MLMPLLLVALAAPAPTPPPSSPPPPSTPSTSSSTPPSTSSPAPSAPPSTPPAVVAAPEAAAPSPAARARLLVLDLSGVGGVDKEQARLITGVVSSLVGECQQAQTLTSADMRAIIDVEANKQSAGCEQGSCLAELAGALDAQYVLYGDAGKLGERFVVTLNLFDAKSTAAANRTTTEVGSLDEMPRALRPAVNELLTPLGGIAVDAAGPSPLLWIGGATAAAGGLLTLGFGAAAVAGELIAGDTTQKVDDKTNAITWGRISLAGAVASAAVAGVGAGVLIAGVME